VETHRTSAPAQRSPESPSPQPPDRTPDSAGTRTSAPPHEEAPGSPPKQHWRQLLAGSSAREVLARILNGDPLALRAHVVERLVARAYLLDADRVHLRSLARCARHALRYRGQPELETWLRGIVDEALLDLLREDAEGERANVAPSADELAAYVELARPLGLEPAAMRAVCVAHNQLPSPERHAFHALVIEGRSLDELARDWREPATEIARRARRGLEAVLVAANRAPCEPTEVDAARAPVRGATAAPRSNPAKRAKQPKPSRGGPP
jgi:DNA-directed RNA polymerase specialized sigma24 family protein